MTCGFLRVYHRKIELFQDLTALPQLLNLLATFLTDLEPHKKLQSVLRKHIHHMMEGRYLDVSNKEQIKGSSNVFKIYCASVVGMMDSSPIAFVLLESFANQPSPNESELHLGRSALINSFKEPIVSHYMTHILQAKSTCSESLMKAAHVVLSQIGQENDFESIFGTLEKTLLRSTESALVIILSFLKHTQVSIAIFLPKLLPCLWSNFHKSD
jgi:hypothetical protein